MSNSVLCKTIENKNIFVFADVHLPFSQACEKLIKINAPKDYNLIFLSNRNIFRYFSLPQKLSINTLRSILGSEFFNFLAVNILYQNGGLFLSKNVVVTECFDIPDIFFNVADVVMYANGLVPCVGYMLAKKNSPTLEKLVNNYNTFLENDYPQSSNDILKAFVQDCKQEGFLFVDSEKSGYMAEKSIFGVAGKNIFKKYYFTNLCSTKEFFETTKGITYIESNFIPNHIKTMNEKTFFEQDFLLAKILKELVY